MTRASIQEYVEAVRGRYLRASKIEKGKILDEFTQVIGCHRKAAIRLLPRGNQAGAKRKRGCPRQCGVAVAEAIRVAWEATDCLCSKRLHPFLPELIKVLKRRGNTTINAEIEAQLCRMSPSTIDRLLRSWRRVGGRRPFTTTKPGSLLENSIPIRTFADWQEDRPGVLEVDLVPHCGESGEGFFLTTLSAVDVASGWSECIGGMGEGTVACGWCCPQGSSALTLSPFGAGLR